jgi:threonine aldolase
MTQPLPPGGKPVDLRSDTVTRPSPAMYKAMMDAPVGDDVLGDDPTVIALQERVAALLGKEAALFTPSGTMANQIALKLHTRPGDAVICEEGCHILNYEGGAPAAISGVVLRTIAGKRGAFTADQVREKLTPGDSHYPRVRVVEIENTHNRASGAIFPQPAITDIAKLCRDSDIALHLDGARLWNAHVAAGIPLDALAEPFDTVSVCFSKGLGCPIGSTLAGNREHIKYAHRIRKYLGGGMRQSGILAGAALYALDHHVERLAEDHENAKLLASAFAEFPHVYPLEPDTNILIVEFDRALYDPEMVRQSLESRGVRSLAISHTRIRFVTHFDVSRDAALYACDVVKDVLGSWHGREAGA